MFSLVIVIWCSVLLLDEVIVGLIMKGLLLVFCSGYLFNELGWVKFSRLCLCSCFICVGVLCCCRYLGLVIMWMWLWLIGCVCRFELCSMLMWNVMLVCFLIRLVMFLLEFSFSFICGQCLWKFFSSGMIMCSMNGVVVFMCRCLIGCSCCVVICFLVLLIVVRIVCVYFRNVVFFLVSFSCCVVCCSSVVCSLFFNCVKVWLVVEMVSFSVLVVVVIELLLIIVMKVFSLFRVVFIIYFVVKVFFVYMV